MKFFYLLIPILVFFTSDVFGYHCYFRSYFENIRVADINGRKIYISFAPHPHTKIGDTINEITALNPEREEAMPRMEEVMVQFQDIISDNMSNVIEPKMDDFHRLSLLLASGQIDWMGTEARPTDFKARQDRSIQNYLSFKSLVTHLEVFPTWDQTDTHKILHYTFSTPTIFQAEYPSNLSRISIVPLEEANVHY